MREGSLDAPVRHPLDWNDPDFFDMEKIEAELERVFDICHGCRRCFNLCDSFPRLFDLIDESPTGELDGVAKKDYKQVVDACTLCDMCFMVSCPYVPPHEFNLDFPHLMLRYRAAELKHGKGSWSARALSATDRNGKLAGLMAPLANWAGATDNRLMRPLMERLADVDPAAALPAFHYETFSQQALDAPEVERTAPAHGRKAVLYATCFVEYNEPRIGRAAQGVLARNGVETRVVYPTCCGMPQFEQGDLADVAARARSVAKEMGRWIDEGYDILALTPSCALMLKFEWPLLLPDDEAVKRLAQATFDVTEYLVDIAAKEGLAPGLQPVEGTIALHLACHSRAQNMGNKARELLKQIPEAEIKMLPRCSGHGGSWGVRKGNFETALKVGKPVARDVYKAAPKYLASECPLAGMHIRQGMERIDAATPAAERKPIPAASRHPVEILAEAYGIPL